MITEIRKTISGTEYWDNKEKRSLFVPIGEEPGFEVIVKPKSMILGMDTGKGSNNTRINLNSMTLKQLYEYAVSINVEIPTDVKKKEDIIDLLS